MTQEQFEREKHYASAVMLGKNMLAKGIINQSEYRKIEEIFRNKYHPLIGTLQSKKP